MPTITVSVGDLELTASAALQRHGATKSAAVEVAKALRRAEQYGDSHCGLRHLELDCAQLASGRVDGRAKPSAHRVKPGLIRADANNGFSQPAFALGFPDALLAAESHGVAVLAISNAYTCGALGYFPELIAERGYVGVAFTNASASVVPPGGTKPVLGTNPIAMSVPDGRGGIAFQFDQCTSSANLRHIREAARTSSPIPEGWAVSPKGEPTTSASEALAGGLLPFGGPKGFSIGLMVEILASFFTDSAMSLHTSNLQATVGPPHGLGIFCLLLDPTAIAGDAFERKLDILQTAVQAQPGTRLPGTGKSKQSRVAVNSLLWERAQILAGA